MAESRWYTRRTRGAKRRQRILEAAGVTAPPEVLVQLRKGFADAEGVIATAGNTRPAGMARQGRSAGVLRPWHAGRETSKTWGDPSSSCTGGAGQPAFLPWRLTACSGDSLRDTVRKIRR